MTTLSKSLIPPEAGTSLRSAQARDANWREARGIFPIYAALAKLLGASNPLGAAKRSLPENADGELYEQVRRWLDQIDQQVQVHQLRHLLQMTTLNASEEGLRAMILRHLRKPAKNQADRDKIDFLLVQYFALCASAKIYHKHIELSDVAQVMKPVLGEVDTAPLDWCAPLERMIEALRAFRSLRDILKTSFIAEGRRAKEAAGGMFYDPAALLAFIRFNFLLRRTFIELMHADLINIRSGLNQLEAAKVRAIDCSQYGLSASEPLSKIQQIADTWKQPFQKEYTEHTVHQAFEKLLALRADVERALERAGIKSGPVAVKTTVQGDSASPAPSDRWEHPGNPAREPTAHAKDPAPPNSGRTVQPLVELDFETCLEQIWEQLIAAPPSRGRSMTTIKMGSARLLMSSWEVTAFVSEEGPSAEDLRRAVTARALVTTALESAKQTGNASGLERALAIARAEVSRLQERLEAAKRAKDTEAAVNLGISTKRLVSTLDEAEKL